jgi:hypothetical protein
MVTATKTAAIPIPRADGDHGSVFLIENVATPGPMS